MKSALATLSALAVLSAAAPASAALYQLHYTGSGQLTADLRISTSKTSNLAGGFDILSVSGDVGGDVVTGIAPLNPANFTTDNSFFAANPIFTMSGVGFFSATTTYNLWGNSPGSYTLYGTTDGGRSYPTTSDGALIATAVPEPAAWSLMIAGFAMVGAVARRRSVAVTA